MQIGPQPYPFTNLPTFNTNTSITNTSLDVFVQDQHSMPIDLYFTKQVLSTVTTAPAERGAYVIRVNNTTGVVVGQACNIIYNGIIYQSVVLGIDGSDVTVNLPHEIDLPESVVVVFGDWNMNVDASEREIRFRVTPPSGVAWDITRIMFSITDGTEMDDGKFGGIASLTKGVFVYVANQDGVKNLFTVFDNGGFAERCFDTKYADRAPSGTYGFTAKKDYRGGHGVTIRLDGTQGDYLAIVLQDNLSDLTKFACVAQGHTVI